MNIVNEGKSPYEEGQLTVKFASQIISEV